MPTLDFDIATLRPDGINPSQFERELRKTYLTSVSARVAHSGRRKDKPGGGFFNHILKTGTLHVSANSSPAMITDRVEMCADNHTPADVVPPLDKTTVRKGNYPGELHYFFDHGSKALVNNCPGYWDGVDSWRRFSDDSVIVTPD